jgi:hypothetical protein
MFSLYRTFVENKDSFFQIDIHATISEKIDKACYFKYCFYIFHSGSSDVTFCLAYEFDLYDLAALDLLGAYSY